MKKREIKLKESGEIQPSKLKRVSATWLFFVFVLFLSMQLYGQSKTVTIKITNGDIEDVLKEIRLQTGTNYLINHEQLQKEKKITIQVDKGSIKEVLKQCFKNTNLTYEIIDNVIIVKPKQLVTDPSEKQNHKSTQTIRGKVIDNESKASLPGANIIILDSHPLIGAITDETGTFRLEGVELGRQTLKVSFIGYESQIVPEILVGSAKEVILTVRLTEKITALKEVSIRPNAKGDPRNEMAIISARSFSIDDSKRFAASVNDPGRIALSFAGVNSDDDETNQIVIRGNSPNGMLWRIEGVQVSPPNHFYAEGLDYGAVSILSTNMLGPFDFYTGAFPAEYGNATSGVFDISLRNGNNEKHEKALQFGFLGADISMEGPFGKNYKGSYLFNYRYATWSMINKLGISLGSDILPDYTDLSFKLNLPTQKAGTFSIWGLGGKSYIEHKAVADSLKWKESNYFTYGYKTNSYSYATGISHIFFPDNKSYFKTIVSYSGNAYKDDGYDLNESTYAKSDLYKDKVSSNALRSSLLYNRKLSSRITMRLGAIYSKLFYNLVQNSRDSITYNLVDYANEDGSTDMYQAYFQSKFKLTNNLTINAGIHYLQFVLNRDHSFEPRGGVRWSFGKNNAISFGIGLHSRHEMLPTYFLREYTSDDEYYLPNKDLKLTKAIHYILGYEKLINKNLKFKTEVYYQDLFDLPVSADPSLATSPINDDYYGDSLVNDGIGRNYGIELTLEKYFTKGYYYLITASIFDSKYKPLDGNWYNTRYNTNYVFNIVGSKEYELKNDKILGLSMKFIWGGGRRDTPIDIDALNASGTDDYFPYVIEKERYTIQFPAYLRLDVGAYYRINKEKKAHIFSVDFQNVTNKYNIGGKFYNSEENKMEEYGLGGILPFFNYRLEF